MVYYIGTFFYWPNFILLPLKSLKMPLPRLRVLSASKIIIVLMSGSAVLLLNFCEGLDWQDSTVKQYCGVIFTDTMIASLLHRSTELSS